MGWETMRLGEQECLQLRDDKEMQKVILRLGLLEQ